MPLYVIQAKLPEGETGDRLDPGGRTQEIEGSLLPLGATLLSHHFTLGAEYDEVMIIDVPETVAVAACVMAAVDCGSGIGEVKATRLIDASRKSEILR